MYLEKLTIQGFKSFANKNTLVFPGVIGNNKRGLTAVVGPNGSGKSNIADSVRWALGEQSMKTLRGKKSEDIIFFGSDKKNQLGMSEVSLYLNNEEAGRGGVGRKAPIEYSQVIITRRLFRNGESEYLINQSRVRLADIQMLLAKANFGQKTYSVIGQGMVEGFLNTTLSERKEFFDEATGVKKFQIKRDESLNKLCNSYENLNQVNMLLVEIEPRLKSLTRQVNKLRKRDEIGHELKKRQINYYSQIWQEINKEFSNYNNQFLELEKAKLEKEKRLAQLMGGLNKMEKENKTTEEFSQKNQKINDLQDQKDDIIKQLARLNAQSEVSFEFQGKFDLSWLYNKKEELNKQIKNIREETKNLESNIGYEKKKFAELEKEKELIDKKIDNFNKELLDSVSREDNKITEKINHYSKNILSKLEDLESQKDINKIQALAKEAKNLIFKLISLAKDENFKKNNLNPDKIHDNLIVATQEKEKNIVKINESNLRISARSERVKLLNEERQKIKVELEKIEDKISSQKKTEPEQKLEKDKQALSNKLQKIDEQLVAAKEVIGHLSQVEEEKRNNLFSLQKDLRVLQDEINQIANRLNEIKVNSTRYETKLEGLEAEARHNLGSLGEIKKNKLSEKINSESEAEKINALKRQLELIGGIDPEIEKEFNETKERFDFLSGQVNDLSSAINSLEKIIKELDLTIKEKFDKEFKLISTKFEEYFKILFNGGQAKIIKMMEDDLKSSSSPEGGLTDKQEKLNSKQPAINTNIKFLQKHNATGLAGIEIQASPPGKKIKAITMLSGGERALTAIALICAIISANPSPFVVLDEVDAALDEANSERLAQILDDLSYKTQFIVITHNRATMRKANILYGVTMKDDGASKLLSIKLDEAKKIK